ncbi:uncharacterized protein [Haliotis asinina]|uniref:uncharacterized protein n=1 Tax=Haliotis asinina TaxID=109174 RepID=UPI003531CE73
MSEKVYIVVRLCVLMIPFLAFVMSHLTASELIALMALQAPLRQSGSIDQGSGSNIFGQKFSCMHRGCKCIPVHGLPGYHVCQCPPGHSLHPTNKLMRIPTGTCGLKVFCLLFYAALFNIPAIWRGSCFKFDAFMFETPGSRLTLLTLLSLIGHIQTMQSNRQPSPTQSGPQGEAMLDA